MENKMIAEISPEIINKGLDILLENAFEKLQDAHDGWSTKNPFSQYIKEIMDERKDKIKEILGNYLMEIVESEDFRLAVKSEYSKMLAKAMLKQVGEWNNDCR